ncbi:MAG: BatA domain-containing protein, partial [Candidatus Hydrothermae bacterium]|nr:BatA domain-containing protein [Candidatus Hydrothermae bacterium]
MTFLQPLALFFLPAALIPLWFYFFGRRLEERIPFPFLGFWEEMEREGSLGRRRPSLWQILLRILLLLSLILA